MQDSTIPVKEKQAADAGSQKDLQEILECLAEIRSRTGYGRIVIDLRGGDIQELEYSVKRRPKLEKKAKPE